MFVVHNLHRPFVLMYDNINGPVSFAVYNKYRTIVFIYNNKGAPILFVVYNVCRLVFKCMKKRRTKSCLLLIICIGLVF